MTEFSWPYPKHKEELVHVVMVILAVLFVALVVTAGRHKAYKQQTLNQDQLQQTASTLAGFTEESRQTVEQSIDGKVTVNFRQSYADQLANQVEQSVMFVASRDSEQAF